jgi:predicted nucleic acid-binding protein
VKVLDPSVAVDHRRGDAVAVELLRDVLLANEPLVASSIVRFELLAGVRESEFEVLETFFGAVTWVPVDEPIARFAGTLARTHGRSHAGVDDADYLIAATVIELRAELLTVNVRHFPMIPGLRAAY